MEIIFFRHADVRSEIVNFKLETDHKFLVKGKDKETLVFDTCVHTGNTMRNITNALEDAGFTKVQMGSISKPDRKAQLYTDFYIASEKDSKTCYPFSSDDMVVRMGGDLTSKRNPDYEDREYSIQIRKEIKNIIDEEID